MVLKKYLLFIFILLSTIIFIGCNNQPEEPKLSISIIGPDEIYEYKSFTYKVEFSTEDEDIINKGVTWSTSDETVLILNPSTDETQTWEELSKYLEGRWSEKIDTNYN